MAALALCGTLNDTWLKKKKKEYFPKGTKKTQINLN